MAMQARERIDWAWFTPSRVGVLRELADDRTEREAGERMGIAYDSVRSIVEDLKNKTGLQSVREMRRWWRGNRAAWLAWCAQLGGVGQERYGR